MADSKSERGGEKVEKLDFSDAQSSSQALSGKVEGIEKLTEISFALYGLPPAYNFWTPDSYRLTMLKRFDCGKQTCEQLITFFQERAALEKQIAELYKEWGARWKASFAKCMFSFSHPPPCVNSFFRAFIQSSILAHLSLSLWFWCSKTLQLQINQHPSAITK